MISLSPRPTTQECLCTHLSNALVGNREFSFSTLYSAVQPSDLQLHCPPSCSTSLPVNPGGTTARGRPKVGVVAGGKLILKTERDSASYSRGSWNAGIVEYPGLMEFSLISCASEIIKPSEIVSSIVSVA